MELVIKIPDEYKELLDHGKADGSIRKSILNAVANGTPLPKGHGKLKDEDEIVKAIEDRVEFLRKNGAIFMRVLKDIDILGCIPKIRCVVPTIIEADKSESEDKYISRKEQEE